MNLWPQTLYLVTHLPFMMEVPCHNSLYLPFMMEVLWHNSLLGRILWLVCDAYGIKSQKQFINTLHDNIKTRGAMDTISTDHGKYEISKKVADLLRRLFIKQYESEPYPQHQNKTEQCYGAVKRYINTLMNLTGAPVHCWLLCLVYALF